MTRAKIAVFEKVRREEREREFPRKYITYLCFGDDLTGFKCFEMFPRTVERAVVFAPVTDEYSWPRDDVK